MAVIQYHNIPAEIQTTIHYRVKPYNALSESILPRYILGDKFDRVHEIRHRLPSYFSFEETPRGVVAVYTAVAELEGQLILEFQGVIVE